MLEHQDRLRSLIQDYADRLPAPGRSMKTYEYEGRCATTAQLQLGSIPFQFLRKACGDWAFLHLPFETIKCRLPAYARALGAPDDDNPTPQQLIDARKLLGYPHTVFCDGNRSRDPRSHTEAESIPH